MNVKKKLRLLQALKMFLGGTGISTVLGGYPKIGASLMIMLGGLDAYIFYLMPSSDATTTTNV